MSAARSDTIISIVVLAAAAFIAGLLFFLAKKIWLYSIPGAAVVAGVGSVFLLVSWLFGRLVWSEYRHASHASCA